MELWSSDDARIRALGTMMGTQDNPKRNSRSKNKKITLLGFDPLTVRLCKSKASYDQNMAAICGTNRSKLEGLIPFLDI